MGSRCVFCSIEMQWNMACEGGSKDCDQNVCFLSDIDSQLIAVLIAIVTMTLPHNNE